MGSAVGQGLSLDDATMLSETAFTILKKKMVENDLVWLIIVQIVAHISFHAGRCFVECIVGQYGERDLRRMRIVLFAFGLVVATMTVGGSGAKTATMEGEAGPPTKPVLLVSMATDGTIRGEGSLSGTVLPPERESVLGAGVLATDSARGSVVDGSQPNTPNAHIPTAVVLLSCALIALATLARRHKTHKSL